jgi:hypothetical protein
MLPTFLVQAEAEKAKKARASLWSMVSAVCNNKDKLNPAEWRPIQAGKERRLVELEERVKALEGQQEVGPHVRVQLPLRLRAFFG